jgi:hypothetical protein
MRDRNQLFRSVQSCGDMKRDFQRNFQCMGYPVFASRLDSNRYVGPVSFRPIEKTCLLSDMANSVDGRTLVGVPDSKSRGTKQDKSVGAVLDACRGSRGASTANGVYRGAHEVDWR